MVSVVLRHNLNMKLLKRHSKGKMKKRADDLTKVTEDLRLELKDLRDYAYAHGCQQFGSDNSCLLYNIVTDIVCLCSY